MITLFFGGLTWAAATAATFLGDMKWVILAFWVAGMSAAGFFLTLGAEVVAVLQAISVTLSSIVAVFYAVTLGEYGARDERSPGRRAVLSILPLLFGVCFFAVIGLGLHGVNEQGAFSAVNRDLKELGKTLVNNHFLSVEILGITFLLVIIGTGVIARPNEKSDGADL